MKKVYYIIFALLNILCLTVSAQINVASNSNGNQLAQIISGNGVTISNVTMNCPTGAAGTFNCVNCDLGMKTGIALTTGCVSNIPGPNDQDGSLSSCDNFGAGDQDLANLINADVSTLFDACTLEFDLKVLSDSVQFNYIFGSEEYPEYACSSFNDVFAFFISGPGIVGSKNIALVPGTNTPVSINTVNDGPGLNSDGSCNTVYPQYYVNNGDGSTSPYNSSPYYIQYDGFTTVLTAKRHGLQPCQTYHLKLAISDVGDGIFDSGVFIEANSLTSNGVAFDSATTSLPNVKNAVRNCVNGIFTLHFQNPVTQNTNVHFKIGGTATNGVDYIPIADSILFHTGDSTAQIVIHPLNSANNSDTETVILYLYDVCSLVPYDSSILLIVDSMQLHVGPNASICAGDSVQLTASSGAVTYSWTPATGLSATNIANPIAFPSLTTTYKCTSAVGSCQTSDLLTITVITPPFSVDAGPDKINCTSNGVQLNATVTGTIVNGHPFVYSWTPATGLSNDSILNPVAAPVSSTTYTINVLSGNCKVKDSVNITIGHIQSTDSATNATCFNSNDGTANVNVTGAPPYIYLWSNNANTQSVSGLAQGTYYVTSTDNLGCAIIDTLVVSSPPAIVFGAPVVTNVSCFGGSDGIISITAIGGNGILNYLWSNGTNANSINNLLAYTPYIVTVTDSNSCTADTSISLISSPQIIANITATNVSCFGDNNGTATANATGGAGGGYTYLWNDNSTTAIDTGLAVGTYSLIVTDSASCTATDSISITQPVLLTATDTGIGPRCIYSTDGTINVFPAGGTSPYQFNLSFNDSAIMNNGSGAFAGLAAGNYSVTVNDFNNCTTSVDLTLLLPQPDVFQYSSTPTSCYPNQSVSGNGNDGVISVTPISVHNGPYNFTIDGGSTQSSNSFYSLSAGTHEVVITNQNDCLTDTSVIVDQPLQGIADIYPSDTTIKLGQSVQLYASFSPYSDIDINSYSWTPTTGLSCTDCFNPVVTTYGHANQYTLTIIFNNKECYTTAQATVIVNGNSPVYIPNAFTPNNDGNNDIFLIYGEDIKTLDLKIFNRWGEEVFKTNSQFIGWDGTFKGLLQNPGVYVYEANITFLDNTQTLKKGAITLIR